MARVARIHIGPMKAGSTTLQAMFAADRARMLEAGYLYPLPPRGQACHTEAILDFMAHSNSPRPPIGPYEIVMLEHRPARRSEAWDRLLAEVAGHPGDAVISSEFLGLFSSDMAAEFLAALPADAVEVVAVKRLVSDMVPSWYQERIKRLPQPPFADFAAAVVAELAAEVPSEYDFLVGGRLAAKWVHPGVEFRQVDARAGLSDEVIVATAEALTPGMTWRAPREAANVSMSAYGTHLWRQHMALHCGAFVGALHEVREQMLATFPVTSGGPKLRMTPSAAATLDDFCEGRTNVLVHVDDVVEPIPVLPFDAASALKQMSAWQQRANRKWRVLDAGSRLVGRGELLRSLT